MKKAHLQSGWNFEIPEIDQDDFDAIVVTDTDECILWVSPGFKSLTGYSSEYAIGRKTSFLTRGNTNQETKQKIKNSIQQIYPVSASQINHRKDGTEYKCHVKILPLFSPEGQLINFMALEKEIQLKKE